MKRIICILITALLLVNGLCGFSAGEDYVFFAEDLTVNYGDEGETFIGIKNNRGFAAYTLEVYYNSEFLELKGCEKAESSDSAYAAGYISVNADTPGKIRCVFASTSNVCSDTELLKLTFKAIKIPEGNGKTDITLDVEFLDDAVWNDDVLTDSAKTEAGNITVKALSDIIINVEGSSEYIENQELDLTKVSVEAVYNNGETKALEPGEYEITGYSSPLKAGEKPTVKYTENGITKEKEAGITVRFKRVIALKVISEGINLSYKEGDILDLTGLRVFKIFDNGQEEELTKAEYTVDKENIPLTVVDTSFKITYNEDSAFSYDIPINVKRKQPKSIRLENIPEEIILRVYEDFYAEGLRVFAVYDDGEEEEITDYTAEGLDGTFGDKTVFIVKEGVKSNGIGVRVVIPGDVTFNGKVQPNDAAAVLRHIVGLEKLKSHSVIAGNVYRDDSFMQKEKVLNPNDAITILKYCAGYEMELK